MIDVSDEIRQGWLHYPPKKASAKDIRLGDLPLIPDGFLPAANDNGQGLVLIELQTGKVWYWRESAWRWGTEDNTRLAFVADDFDGFINALRPELS